MTVVITGASSGIGKALAYEFASQGCDIIAVARREQKLIELKKDLESKYAIKLTYYICDLSKEDQVHNLYKGIKNDHDFIDLWINNAGLGDYSLTWEADITKLQTMIDVNIKALMILSSLFVKDYKDKKSTLINVSSGGGYFVFNKAVPYCASKFFVSAFTEGLAQNLKQNNHILRVKILCPGGTSTEFADRSSGGFKGEDIFDYQSFMQPEHLAKLTYDFYKNEATIGMVTDQGTMEFREPIFPYGG